MDVQADRISPHVALGVVVGLWLCVTALRPGTRPLPADPFPEPFVPDVNVAPAAQLLLLPRIGPCRAKAILEERSRHGPFADVDDLQRVWGIGPKTVAGLCGLARADDP